MCLGCTSFPGTILARANSPRQSAPRKASYCPRCRLSHRKAAASPAPLLPWVGSRHEAPVTPPALPRGSPAALALRRVKLGASGAGNPLSSAASELGGCSHEGLGRG